MTIWSVKAALLVWMIIMATILAFLRLIDVCGHEYSANKRSRSSTDSRRCSRGRLVSVGGRGVFGVDVHFRFMDALAVHVVAEFERWVSSIVHSRHDLDHHPMH